MDITNSQMNWYYVFVNTGQSDAGINDYSPIATEADRLGIEVFLSVAAGDMILYMHGSQSDADKLISAFGDDKIRLSKLDEDGAKAVDYLKAYQSGKRAETVFSSPLIKMIKDGIALRRKTREAGKDIKDGKE